MPTGKTLSCCTKTEHNFSTTFPPVSVLSLLFLLYFCSRGVAISLQISFADVMSNSNTGREIKMQLVYVTLEISQRRRGKVNQSA